jgi:histidine transport system permease protein
MIELFQQYGLAYLFSDGAGLSGVAMTLWLFILSVLFGFSCRSPWRSPASRNTSGCAGR